MKIQLDTINKVPSKILKNKNKKNYKLHSFLTTIYSIKTFHKFIKYYYNHASFSYMMEWVINYGLWVKSGPLPVSTHKVLLEHSHVPLYCLHLLSHYNSRDEKLQQRPYRLQSLKCLFSGPL